MEIFKKHTSVSVALVLILKNYVERIGGDFAAIAGSEWNDLSAFGDGSRRISGKQFESIWQKIVSATQDPHPGLNFGREIARNYPGGSTLFTMMMNCATIGQALDTFIRYHSIMADFIQPQMYRDEEFTYLSWQTSRGTTPSHPVLAEALICTYSYILGNLSKGMIQPVEVCFSHVGPDDLGMYRQIFKSPIIFEAARNELVITSDSLDITISLANQELFEVLENYAARLASAIGREDEWSSKVIRLTGEMLLKGVKPDIDAVSKQLALSRRSLQAKLKVEQTTFRNCLMTVRKQIALDYLAKPETSLCDVAFLLGYSEQSAFNHAFKRWTGKSPKEYCHNST